MKTKENKLQQKICAMFQRTIHFTLHIFSKLCVSLKKGSTTTENNLCENEKNYKYFLTKYPNEKDRLINIQEYLTDFFNGKIVISRETRVELINFMEEYFLKHENKSVISAALAMTPMNKQNKN